MTNISDPKPGCRLYLITPPRINATAFAIPLAEALDAGDVAARLLDVADGVAFNFD